MTIDSFRFLTSAVLCAGALTIALAAPARAADERRPRRGAPPPRRSRRDGLDGRGRAGSTRCHGGHHRDARHAGRADDAAAAVFAAVAAAPRRGGQRHPLRHRVRVLRQRHGRVGQHRRDDVARQLQADAVAGADGAPGRRAERRAGDGRRRHVVRQSDRRRSRSRRRSTASAGRRSGAPPSRIGGGGGNMPDAGAAAANAAGIRARSAMDNAMFAVNYFTAIAGGGVAYVDHKLTVQLEATLLQLFRVRGDGAASGDRLDAHQLDGRPARRVLHRPDAVRRRRAALPALADHADAAGDGHDHEHRQHRDGHGDDGDRTARPLPGRQGVWLRPGIAYARGLDTPLTTSSYNMVQVDVPFYF